MICDNAETLSKYLINTAEINDFGAFPRKVFKNTKKNIGKTMFPRWDFPLAQILIKTKGSCPLFAPMAFPEHLKYYCFYKPCCSGAPEV